MKKMKMYLMTAMLGVASLSMVFTSCETDECKDVICENGGLCNETDGSCDCPAGYEGTSCETQSISKFLGTANAQAIYAFNDMGGTACGDYTGNMNMSASTVDDTKLILTNLGGFGTTTSVNATVSGDQITIPSQAITGATNNTVSGSGIYSNGVVTGSYTNNDGVTTCTYSFTWTKQ